MLQHNETQKDIQNYKSQKDIHDKIINDWKESQMAEKRAKATFRESLVQRVSIIKSELDQTAGVNYEAKSGDFENSTMPKIAENASGGEDAAKQEANGPDDGAPDAERATEEAGDTPADE
jgi:hypothetical protein